MKKWKEMSWKDKAQVIAFGVLLLLVVILIPLFIILDEDPGFTNPDASWDHMPLIVTCSNYAGGMDGCSTADASMDSINTRLGFEAFSWNIGGVTPDVVITVGVPSEQGWVDPGGHTILTGSSPHYDHCEVITSNVTGIHLLDLVLQHELACHCLGLQHDPDNNQSICRPVQSRTPSGEIGPWISDGDRRLLREKYK